MSHVLGIGFWCDVYKKNPRVRVFFDGQFLEEYEITHDPVPEWGTSPNGRQSSPDRAIFRYPEAKLFAIEDHQLEGKESIEIRVEVENDDNNYTNGFMTKYTSLLLKTFFFCPLELITNREKAEPYVEKHMKWFAKPFSSTNNWHVFFNKYKSTDRKVVYPFLTTFAKWSGREGQVVDNILDYTLGGSGVYTVKICKKHGIWIPMKKTRPWGMIWLQPLFIKNFLWGKVAKYLRNENNRSNHTKN